LEAFDMSDQTLIEADRRPKLWRYYRERGLSRVEVSVAFDRTPEWVRLICLPFGDPKRRVPSPEDVQRFWEWSQGAISPADWYPPALNAPPSAEAAEASR
jgi:hypothetical protein